jgi:hypothetical protein
MNLVLLGKVHELLPNDPVRDVKQVGKLLRANALISGFGQPQDFAFHSIE